MKNLRKSSFVILTLIAINLFIIIIFGIVKASNKSLDVMNKVNSESRVALNFNDVGDHIKIKNYIYEIMKIPNITINFESAADTEIIGSLSQGIYYSNKFENDFNILSGRMFNNKDITDKKHLAVIGKDFEKKIYTKKNLSYIKRNGEEYQVIGIMGEKNKPTLYDNLFLYNINSVLDNTKVFNGVFYFTSNKYSSKELMEILQKILNTNDVAALYEIGKVYENLTSISISTNKNILISCFLIVICFICTLIRSLILWIDKIKVELGIRKALGATKCNLIFLILKRYSIIYILSSIISLLISIIIIKLNLIKTIDFIIDLNVIYIYLALFFIFAVITLTTLYQKINTINTSKLIRE